MRELIIVILSLVVMAIGYTALMRKRIEVTLPLAVFTSILVLYIFGLAGKLHLGVYAFFLLAAVGFLAGFIKALACKEFKSFVGNIFTIGFFVFVGATIYIYFMTKGRLFSNFDEFTHWGLTVKNFIVFDGFANIKGSTTHGAGYQPGISVFCYLFTALKGKLSECDAIRAMNIYIVTMLLPIFRKVRWRRIFIGLCMIPLIGAIPWLFSFAITPYNTLYADAALAVTFAYLLFEYITHGQNAGNYISLALGSAVLILIKPSSEVFALAILLLVIIDIIAFKRKEFADMWRRKGAGLSFLLYIILSLASYISWKYFTAVNKMLQVFDYIEVTNEKTQDASNVISNFIKAITSTNGNEKLNMPYVWWFLIFICLMLVAVIIVKDKKEKGRVALYGSLLTVGFACFLAALCFMYIFLFIPVESESLASLDRYVCTYLLGTTIFFIYYIIDAVFQRFGGLGNVLILFPIALVLLFAPWGKIDKDMIHYQNKVEKTITKRAKFSKAEKTFKQMDYKKDRVYFIAQNTHGLDYQTAYYLATPVSLSYDYEMGWSLGDPYSVDDIWTLDMSKEEWEKALIDGEYTYVYFYKVDDRFIDRYGDLFEDEKEIEKNTCFKIEKSGKHVLLKKAFAK